MHAVPLSLTAAASARRSTGLGRQRQGLSEPKTGAQRPVTARLEAATPVLVLVNSEQRAHGRRREQLWDLDRTVGQEAGSPGKAL